MMRKLTGLGYLYIYDLNVFMQSKTPLLFSKRLNKRQKGFMNYFLGFKHHHANLLRLCRIRTDPNFPLYKVKKELMVLEL